MRAAFFHVGVLARLADLDLLSRVRVLSTVSGGSIVGALLYLHLKRRYETESETSDRQIVGEILDALTVAGKQDLRTCAFRNPVKSLRMGLWSGFSRSDRMAELYERHLYRPFAPTPSVSLYRRLLWKLGDASAFWRGRPRVRLRDLAIQCNGEPPLQLMVNATSLNTGHGWRFEATMMGEPRRGPVRRVLDDNERLERVHFEADPPQRFAEFDLARAVAASACFPGFEPLPLRNLYEGRKIELVDGGVFDNQGIHALRHRDCTHYVVSDGSGRLQDARRPHTRLPAVLSRAYGIAAGRVREDQLIELLLSAPSSAIVDIKGGCVADAVRWRPDGDTDEAGFVEFPDLDQLELPDSSSAWNVHPRVQRLLSEIRTDLDHFSEVERHSLMLAGYRNARLQLERPGGIAELFEAAEQCCEADWPFSDVAPLLDSGNDQLKRGYARQLRAGRRRLFRLPSLVLPVPVQLVVAVAALAALVWQFADDAWELITSDVPALALIVPAMLWTVPMLVPPALKERSDYFGRALMWGIVPTLLWPVVLLQLFIVRPLYQRLGRVSRFL